jgi:hypothetical protein
VITASVSDFDHQPENTRLLTHDADADDDVADAPDGLAERAQHQHPREPRDVYPVNRRHG